ncbi:MAG TPA: nickel pincer cofactor biosynthesis protein LarC [Nitrospirota bacterium]|nr:nickel pincer cofactor biosynthesis protein LarC [Nitrospirota bacterium]
MAIAYFDCFSGISGDMTLGALVDAGASIDALRSELDKLHLAGYEIRSEKVKRSGIAATKVHVIIAHEEHHHRNLASILDIIDGSSLSATVKQNSGKVFKRLADAEAKVHGTTTDHIHFHEVGAIDSIVDIVGSVICFELLGISQIMSSSINVGSGTVQTAHGILPVPAPATAEMLRGIPFYESVLKYELTTPTGAAIISTLGTSFGSLPPMKIDCIAYGAGDKNFPNSPNVLRVMLGDLAVSYDEDSSIVIETNIDDMNPQIYDYVIEKLMQQGAQDAYLTPIIMKKGRPAILLSVLTDTSKTAAILDTLFRETTSIGVRIQEVGRKKLTREIKYVETIYGKLRIKISKRGDDIFTVTPEYEDCKRIAEERKIPLKDIFAEAKNAYSPN